MEYMLKATEGLLLDVYFTLPSCVPSTSFDESGCVLRAADLECFYHHERVIGLAEVMDYIGTIHGDEEILTKIEHAKLHHKIVDGHAPGLRGKEACAYVLAGIGSDHECVSFEEAKEKLSLGQWIMIREGTAAKNLEALIGLFEAPYYQRAMLITDDKHPYDLLQYGHIDAILRKAIKLGADPCKAIKMATLNTAVYFGLKNTGAIAPGYKADIVILTDLTDIKVEKVIKNGELIMVESNLIELKEPEIDNDLLGQIYNSFHCKEIGPESFEIPDRDKDSTSESFRVIQFVRNEIFTKEIKAPLNAGRAEVSLEADILKIAAIERHHHTNHIGIGFANGYGLNKGAIASSVSHDSHNIIVIGTNDLDMAVAANCIRDMQGGWAIADGGKVIANLPLSIAGLMSDLGAVELSRNIEEMKQLARELGVTEGIDPFMTLAFVSLPVIPELRLITTGLFDVDRQQRVSIII
jgi:adenine deaminase